MAKLTEEQKTYIVQRLACFRTPSEVVEDVKEEFGVELKREHVRQYNPLQVVVAKKWRVLFDASREEFVKAVAAAAVAHQAYRLRELDDLYRDAKRGKNKVLAAQLLKQAAEEIGGVYTNKRELSGRLDVANLTDEELAKIAGAGS